MGVLFKISTLYLKHIKEGVKIMNYCLTYKTGRKHLKDADEILCHVQSLEKDNDALIKVLDTYLDKKIILAIDKVYSENKEDYEWFSNCYPNILFCIQRIDFIYFKSFNLKDAKFMYADPASSFTTLNEYILDGVSEIYISGEIAFSLKDVTRALKDTNIKIRAMADIAQGTPGDIRSFFIRPEDVPIYDQYISTIEFWQYDKEDTLFEIYHDDKVWNDDINFIICGLNFDSPIINSLLFCFGKERCNCDKRCMRGWNCNFCNSIKELAKYEDKHNENFASDDNAGSSELSEDISN